MRNIYVRHAIAEFVGIFTLVFIGGGAIMMAQHTQSQAALLLVALAHGLALAVMVSSVMGWGPAHFNSAVTIAMLITRRLAPSLAAVYLVAQLIGAVAAAYALQATFPAELVSGTRIGGQAVALDVNTTQAIILEAIATFFLAFVIYGTAVSPSAPRIGGLAIGLTIAAGILAIGPLTGASMNPARSFGPALVSGVWEGQLIYWIGPIIGASLAAALWEFVLLEREPRT